MSRLAYQQWISSSRDKRGEQGRQGVKEAREHAAASASERKLQLAARERESDTQTQLCFLFTLIVVVFCCCFRWRSLLALARSLPLLALPVVSVCTYSNHQTPSTKVLRFKVLHIASSPMNPQQSRQILL